MAELKTNYVDDKLNVVENTDRVFNLIDKDGNVIYTAISLIEITKYLTVGSQFGADDINAMTVQINANTTDIEELKKGGDGKGIAVKTYAEWQTMTPEQRNNGAYYVPDYPVGYTIGDVIDKVDDIEQNLINQNANPFIFNPYFIIDFNQVKSIALNKGAYFGHYGKNTLNKPSGTNYGICIIFKNTDGNYRQWAFDKNATTYYREYVFSSGVWTDWIN